MAVMPEHHGAAGDGSQDDGPALRAAMEAAAGSGADLVLGSGCTYRAGAGPAREAVLECLGPRPVRLRGEGATLVVSEPSSGAVLVRGSVDVHIDGLTIDYDPLPYTQGEIIGVSGRDRSFIALPDDGFPSLGHAGFRYASDERLPSSFMTVFDGKDLAIKQGLPDFILLRSATRRSDGLFDVVLSDRNVPFDLEVGDRYAYIQRERGHCLVFDRCGPVSISHVTVLASPGVAFLAVETERLTVRNSTVSRPAGSRRLISTNADAVHCQGCRTGPAVSGCLFERMLDDGVNVYASPSLIIRAEGDTIWLRGGTSIRPGDELEVFDHRAGVLRGLEWARDVAAEVDGTIRVRLSRAVPKVTAADGFPACDVVVNRSSSGHGCEIRGNTFRWSRARAVVLRAGGGRVADNDIHDLSAWGIEVANDPNWPEGPLPSDVLISNNRIGPVGRAIPSPAILIGGRRTGGDPPSTALVHDVQVLDNAIRDWSGPAAIVVDGADAVWIDANAISHTEGMVGRTGVSVGAGATVSIRARESDRDPVGGDRSTSQPGESGITPPSSR